MSATKIRIKVKKAIYSEILKQLVVSFWIPLNPPLIVKNSIPIHDNCQRGTSTEQSWFFNKKFLKVKQGEKYRLEIPDLTGDETGMRVEIFIPEEN